MNTIEEEFYAVNELIESCFNDLAYNEANLEGKRMSLHQFMKDLNEMKNSREFLTDKKEKIQKFIDDIDSYNSGLDDSTIKLDYLECKSIFNRLKTHLNTLYSKD